MSWKDDLDKKRTAEDDARDVARKNEKAEADAKAPVAQARGVAYRLFKEAQMKLVAGHVSNVISGTGAGGHYLEINGKSLSVNTVEMARC